MGVVVRGLENLVASLKNKAERSSRGAREALEQGAEDIKDLAVLYAPVDEGNLEKSIKVGKFADVTNRRRNTYIVYVDEDVPAKHGKKVGDYAEQMHEGVYNLGPLSEDKQDSLGVIVGRKYLERAMDDLDEKIRFSVESKVNQGIGH